MNLNKYIFLLIIPLFLSCNNSDENVVKEKPANIIPEQEMIELLVDIHLIEGTTRYGYGKSGNQEDYNNYLYEFVLEKHNISFDDFTKSISYYTRDIQRMTEIYSEVITELSELQSKVKNEK